MSAVASGEFLVNFIFVFAIWRTAIRGCSKAQTIYRVYRGNRNLAVAKGYPNLGNIRSELILLNALTASWKAGEQEMAHRPETALRGSVARLPHL
jgi:hypothetical protein